MSRFGGGPTATGLGILGVMSQSGLCHVFFAKLVYPKSWCCTVAPADLDGKFNKNNILGGQFNINL